MSKQSKNFNIPTIVRRVGKANWAIMKYQGKERRIERVPHLLDINYSKFYPTIDDPDHFIYEGPITPMCTCGSHAVRPLNGVYWICYYWGNYGHHQTSDLSRKDYERT